MTDPEGTMPYDYSRLHRIARTSLRVRLLNEAQQLDEAAFRLLSKLHTETQCGTVNDDHWAECDGLVAVFGYESWEHWQALREASLTTSTDRIEKFLNEQVEPE